MQTAFGAAGIHLLLREATGSTVTDEAYECAGKTTAHCPANAPTLSYWGSPSYTYVPTYYPSGDTLFGCGAETNAGNYCNHQVQALIDKVAVQATPTSIRTFHQLDSLLAKQLPVLWMPTQPEQISAVSPKLGGVTSQDASAYIYPSTWYLKP